MGNIIYCFGENLNFFKQITVTHYFTTVIIYILDSKHSEVCIGFKIRFTFIYSFQMYNIHK